MFAFYVFFLRVKTFCKKNIETPPIHSYIQYYLHESYSLNKSNNLHKSYDLHNPYYLESPDFQIISKGNKIFFYNFFSIYNYDK